MTTERIFIGWDTPVVEKVREFLIPQIKEREPVDLSATLIIVPTSEAGRKLRHELALYCSLHNTTLLSTTIVTPSFLFTNSTEKTKIPPFAVIYGTWVKTLTAINPQDYSHLFPLSSRITDNNWIYSTALELIDLRETVLEGGYLLHEAVKILGNDFPEIERWKELTQLEKLFITNIRRTGYEDPCEAKKNAAVNPCLPDNIQRIVVAATPDPSPLALRALDSLAKKTSVEILIPAPESLKAMFDEWGRPLISEWKKFPLEIPKPNINIHIAVNPADQSTVLINELMRFPAKFAPSEIGIGVPDRSVIPHLLDDLKKIMLDGFDPAQIPLQKHRISILFSSYAEFITNPSYKNTSLFLRNADVLAYLKSEQKINTVILLKELDEFQNTYLPLSFDNIRERIKKDDHFVVLKKVSDWLTDIYQAYEKSNNPIHAIRNFFMAIMKNRTLSEKKEEDIEFKEAAFAFDEALHQTDETLGKLEIKDKKTIFSIIYACIKDKGYNRRKPAGSVDLEGWLELLWLDSPCLAITGMNEGIVPYSKMADVFIPDSIRRKLNLPDSEQRYARDAFITTVLIKNRLSENKRIFFICGKKNANGDPIKPSRLLFQCDDNQLVERAEQLFHDITPSRPVPPASPGFLLNPVPPQNNPLPQISKLSVTTFRDYLTCPFRFYLKHILGMERLCDDKQEPDALDFGILIHDVMRILQDVKTDSADAIFSSLEHETKKIITERFGNTPPIPVIAAMEAAIKRLQKAAEVQAKLFADGWKIYKSELPLKAEIEGVTIIGKIDRIDINEKQGKVRIIDYKTADSPTNNLFKEHLAGVPDNAKEKEWRLYSDPSGKSYKWQNLQMPLYSWLWKKTKTLETYPVELCYFVLPVELEKTAVIIWENYNVQIENSAYECAQGIIQSIKDNIFWPPSEIASDEDDFHTIFPIGIEKTVDAAPLLQIMKGQAK